MPGTIRKACDLLRALDGVGEAGCRLADLAQGTGLTAPTTHRILRTLCDEGFATQDPATRRYRLGPAAASLGHPAPLRERLCEAAAPVLRELRDDSGETIALVALADGHRRVLATLESQQPLRVVPSGTDDERFYETATGRAILALLPVEDFAPLRKRLGWPGRRWPGVFTDRDLARELQVIRMSSLVVAEQRDSSITAMATPLPIPGIHAAIGIDYPAGRDSGGRRQTLGARLREAAHAIRARFLA